MLPPFASRAVARSAAMLRRRADRRTARLLREGGKSLFIGFVGWKRDFYKTVFPDRDIVFLSETQCRSEEIVDAVFDCVRDADIHVWSYKDPYWLSALCAVNGCRIVRVEDGFLRSVGLGAQRIQPLSIILERGGDLFFHMSRSSSLHRLLRGLNAADKTAFHERGLKLKDLLLQDNLSKYNFRSSGPDVELTENAVLVLGQVERDESIRRGPDPYQTCEQLIELALAENPDATVYFKPHPEVHRGIAEPYSAPFRRFPDLAEFPQSVNMFDHASRFRRVYTISSLAGFEMLLRGVPVTTLGGPWYGGWGLTDDRAVAPEEQQGLSPEMLLWAAYGEYPLYLTEEGARNDVYSVIDLLQRQLAAD